MLMMWCHMQACWREPEGKVSAVVDAVVMSSRVAQGRYSWISSSFLAGEILLQGEVHPEINRGIRYNSTQRCA